MCVEKFGVITLCFKDSEVFAKGERGGGTGEIARLGDGGWGGRKIVLHANSVSSFSQQKEHNAETSFCAARC